MQTVLPRFLLPHIAHEALPAIAFLRELVAGFPGGKIARSAELDQFVQLPHRHAAGAFDLIGVGFTGHRASSKAAEPAMLNSYSTICELS